LAAQETDTYKAREEAATQLGVEAAAEQYASAAEWERQVREYDNKLNGLHTQCLQVAVPCAFFFSFYVFSWVCEMRVASLVT